MFAKPAGKKAERFEKEGQLILDPTLDVDAPGTKPFLENPFTTLRDDIVPSKQELAADVKDIRCNMGELEQRVDSLEWGSDNRHEELEVHKREILTLRDKTADLNYQLEDIENCSGRCNIRIKGVSLQADPGRLKEYVLRLFCYVAPDLVEQDILLDRTHRAGQPASSPGQPQDILTCLHLLLAEGGNHGSSKSIYRIRRQQSVALSRSCPGHPSKTKIAPASHRIPARKEDQIQMGSPFLHHLRLK
ncbi:hypothetical protein NDU88_010990 [Pleurodeles waltl]|uniref:Uncharacterized protein n=1 Tax=Pleurodeles waltl TaxID=8319 RepID=A0AAV7PZH8_PLEWA|nr:hypothetical protein NDU88_010990 [Pleurodeles waltl]